MSELTIWEQLKAPITDDEVEWRVQRCGIASNGNMWASLVPYVQARAVMDRLDAIVGPENWSDEYTQVYFEKDGDGFMGKLSITVGDKTITKVDGAPLTDIEGIKGGISGALKRVAVKFGIGRDLYDLNAVTIFDVTKGYPPKGDKRAVSIVSKKDNINGWCYPPKLDDLRSGNTNSRQPDEPPPKKETPPPKPQQQSKQGTPIKERCISGVDKLLMDGAVTPQDRDDAIATWLETKTIQECGDDTKLEKFFKEWITPSYMASIKAKSSS